MTDLRRDTFALHGQRAIQLDADGLCHPQSPRGDAQVFTRYEDVTHLAATGGGLLLGTRQSAFVVPRGNFVDPEGPEALVQALLSRIAALEGGPGQIARMAAVDRAAREPQPVRATWVLAGVCVLLELGKAWLGPELLHAGEGTAALVRDGDLWRLLTTSVLHASLPVRFLDDLPIHLLTNLAGLVLLGSLVERCLGTARCICVMVSSAALSTLAALATGPDGVVGASGIVFGLVGAVVWLELFRSAELPAWLRIPRRSILILLLLNGALMLIPFISGAAHLGGLAAGFATTAWICRGSPVLGAEAPVWVRSLAHALALMSAASLAIAGWDLLGRGDFGPRFTRRIAELPGIHSHVRHQRAFEVASDPGSSRADLLAALEAEERAVAETSRRQPEMLETLAELQFRLGRTEQALTLIDEAIALAPEEPSFRSRRDHFLLGEVGAGSSRGELPPWLPDPQRDAPSGARKI